jgi:hypothetical protein
MAMVQGRDLARVGVDRAGLILKGPARVVVRHARIKDRRRVRNIGHRGHLPLRRHCPRMRWLELFR